MESLLSNGPNTEHTSRPVLIAGDHDKHLRSEGAIKDVAEGRDAAPPGQNLSQKITEAATRTVNPVGLGSNAYLCGRTARAKPKNSVRKLLPEDTEVVD